MTFLPLVLIGAIAAVPCAPPRCVCAEESTDDSASVLAAFDEADAVLLGRVVANERVRIPGDADDTFADWREVTVDVQRRWKGEAGRVRVRTPWHPALCGFPFETRGEYLIYARVDDDGRLETSACSRTRRRDRAEADTLSLDRIVGIGSGLAW